MKSLSFYSIFLYAICILNLNANPYQASNLEDLTLQIYRQSGVSQEQVPPNHFKAAYIRYLRGKKDGEFLRPIISFVNFNLPSSKERLFIVDVSSGSDSGLILSTITTHGFNSGGLERATKFSNIEESFQSSLGYYRVAERDLSQKTGDMIRVDGLSGSQFNSLARSPRGIQVHTAKYATLNYFMNYGRVGRSGGCFVIPRELKESIYETIYNGTMLYAFYGNDPVNPGSTSGLLEIAQSDTGGSGASVTKGDPLEGVEDLDIFKGAKTPLNNPDFTSSLGQLSHLYNQDNSELPEEEIDPTIPANNCTTVPFNGTKAHCNCQGSFDAPFDQVAQSTQSGSDPTQHTLGTWIDLDNNTKNAPDITYSQDKIAAELQRAHNEECVALASITDTNNFSRSNPNQATKDVLCEESIECNYQGVECRDCTQCIELARTICDYRKIAANRQHEQRVDIQQKGNNSIKELNNSSDIQFASAEHINDLVKTQGKYVETRQSDASLAQERIATALAKMPTLKTVLNECQQHSPKFSQSINNQYNAYVSTIPDIKTDLPQSMGDPCNRIVLQKGIKFIQNAKAKKQATQILKNLGYKMEDLEKKRKTLESQSSVYNSLIPTGDDKMNFRLAQLKDFDSVKPTEIKEKKTKMRMPSSSSSASLRMNHSRSRFSSRGSKSQFSNIDWNTLAKSFKAGAVTRSKSNIPRPLIDFVTMLKKGRVGAIVTYMQGMSLGEEDLLKALESGIISNQKYQKILSAIQSSNTPPSNSDRGLASGSSQRNPNNQSVKKNTSWQIEKDADQNLFEIITRRYLRKPELYAPID